MKRRKFYYTDELNDDFANVDRQPLVIDDKYKYDKKGVLWKLCEVIVYRVFMMPFAYLYMKIKFHHKVVGKEKLKGMKSKGYFMYGNHTLMAGDAFIPNVINCPNKTYTIVHSDNISIPITRPFLEMSGAIPLPNTLTATRNFLSVIKKRIEGGYCVMIYPEAHIWPYYTGIRNFKSTSFKYPIDLQVPVFSLTNTYHKRKFSKNPKIITYIDGPFKIDLEETNKQQVLSMRDVVYKTMCERAKENTYHINEFIKGDKVD